jgi:hypothetical protein
MQSCNVIRSNSISKTVIIQANVRTVLTRYLREISSSHGGEYDVQSCLLGCTAV